MIIVVGNGKGEPSSNPGRDSCISHNAYALGKNRNPVILLSAVGKKQARLGSIAFIWQPVYKENSGFKSV